MALPTHEELKLAQLGSCHDLVFGEPLASTSARRHEIAQLVYATVCPRISRRRRRRCAIWLASTGGKATRRLNGVTVDIDAELLD
jgi:hypothetical protein